MPGEFRILDVEAEADFQLIAAAESSDESNDPSGVTSLSNVISEGRCADSAGSFASSVAEGGCGGSFRRPVDRRRSGSGDRRLCRSVMPVAALERRVARQLVNCLGATRLSMLRTTDRFRQSCFDRAATSASRPAAPFTPARARGSLTPTWDVTCTTDQYKLAPCADS